MIYLPLGDGGDQGRRPPPGWVDGPRQSGRPHPARIARTAERGSAGSSPSSRTHTDAQRADPAGKAKLHQTLDPSPWLRSEDRRPPGGGPGSVPEGVGAQHLGRSRPPMLLEPHQVKLGANPRHAGQRPGDAHQVKHLHKCETRVRQPSAVYVGEAVSQCGRWPRGSLLRVGRGRLEATGMASPGRRARVSGLYPCSGPCKG